MRVLTSRVRPATANASNTIANVTIGRSFTSEAFT
jgi:hypothetical protein